MPAPAPREARAGAGPSTPETSLLAFVAALRRGDVERAAACFASDACFLTPDATIIQGRVEIAEILSQFRATGVGIGVEIRAAALRAGETALTAERWTVRAGAGETTLIRTFDSRTVLRRFGTEWRLLLLAPWGWR